MLKGIAAAFFLLSVFPHTLCEAGESMGALRPASAIAPSPNQPAVQPPAPLIELDGTISISPDGSELSYEWKQISGPAVELSDPHAAKPFFRTAKPGTYEFQLVVSANGLSSEPHTVRLEIEHENLPPVAKVPAEAFGQVGTMLEINGRDSFDPEGQSLVYRWRPLTPGLNIPLSALAMPVLAFEPQIDGVFEVELIVSDGEKTSIPALCRVTVKPKPKPPVAQARIITVGIQPDSTAQANVQSGPKKPARPIAQVRSIPEPNRNQPHPPAPASAIQPPPPAGGDVPVPTEVAASIPSSPEATASSVPALPMPPNPEEHGAPASELSTILPQGASAGSDALLPPLPNTDWTPSRLPPPREVTSNNSTPVAPITVPPLAGHADSSSTPDMAAAAHITVPVIGSGYVESESLMAPPSAPSSALLEPSPMMPPAQPEQPRYDVMSAPKTRLPFDRPRPSARIKGPKLAEVGKPVFLDGRGSGNGLSDSLLDYVWHQTKGPDIQNVETVYGGAGKQFQAPLPGVYEFTLLVSDGGVQSAPARHTIKFTDQAEPPVAVVVAPTRAYLGALVTMDARQSYDMSGEKLIYRWRQTGGPSVRNYVIDERLGDSAPAFYPPAPGTYSFELIVSNGKMNSRSVEIDIDVEAKLRTPVEISIVGPSRAMVGEKVELRTNVGSGDDGELSYQWRQKEGPEQALTSLGNGRATVYPVEAGRYVFEVTALEGGAVAARSELSLQVEGLESKGEDKDVTAREVVEPRESQQTRSQPGLRVGVVGEARGASRVPELTPLPNTPVVPPITSFPTPTLPGDGRGRPAARVMRGGRPPLADL